MPRPLNFEELPAAPANARKGDWAETLAIREEFHRVAARVGTRSINNRVATSPSDTFLSRVVKPADICTAPNQMRVPAAPGTPKADGAAKILLRTVNTWPPPGGCAYANPDKCTNCDEVFSCSGNTLSNGLVVMAAHCMDAEIARRDLVIKLRNISNYPEDADPCNIASLPVTLKDVLVRNHLQFLQTLHPRQTARPAGVTKTSSACRFCGFEFEVALPCLLAGQQLLALNHTVQLFDCADFSV